MTSERKYQIRHSLYLLLTAVIWGVAFVAQSVGMEHVGPFTFNAARFFLGTLTLLPFILLRSGRGKKRIAEYRFSGREESSGAKYPSEGREESSGAEYPFGGREEVPDRGLLLKAGLLCGTALAVASNLQQIGIKYTTVGKAGFLTAMYIVLVPILGIFVGRKAGGKVWLAVLTAFFSVQIMLVDRFAPGVDGVQLAAFQFLVSGTVSAVCMLLTEEPSFSQLRDAALPILYAGVLSCGAAYTLQVIGQKGMNPTVASLIMSLESTVSVIAGFLILHQTMTRGELTGCVLMACAIVLAQI